MEKAEAALGEIFDRFDGDKDGQWTIKDTQNFAIATNGKPFNTESPHPHSTHQHTTEAGRRERRAGRGPVLSRAG